MIRIIDFYSPNCVPCQMLKKELEVLNPVNFNSPAQMGELFFTSPKGFKFEIIKYTTDKQKNETNNPSTDEEVLFDSLKDITEYLSVASDTVFKFIRKEKQHPVYEIEEIT